MNGQPLNNTSGGWACLAHWGAMPNRKGENLPKGKRDGYGEGESEKLGRQSQDLSLLSFSGRSGLANLAKLFPQEHLGAPVKNRWTIAASRNSKLGRTRPCNVLHEGHCGRVACFKDDSDRQNRRSPADLQITYEQIKPMERNPQRTPQPEREREGTSPAHNPAERKKETAISEACC